LPKSCPCLQGPLAGGDKAQAPKLVGGGDKISGGLGHGVAAGCGSGTLLVFFRWWIQTSVECYGWPAWALQLLTVRVHYDRVSNLNFLRNRELFRRLSADAMKANLT